MRVFHSKNVVVGVTGSIAAYKAAALVSRLDQLGARVQVAMTHSAAKFVGPLTFESLTRRRVLLDVLELGEDSEIDHVAVAKTADIVIIAPATAHSIARLAAGMAGDVISALALDSKAPLLIAPAMETGMWENPATRENISRLRVRGVTVVEPGVGHLASGAVGAGRLADPEDILGAARRILARAGKLAGKKVIVTAGGTQEQIDPVRVITNRSSGKMGYAIAEAALDRGAEVCLITATELHAPSGANVLRVWTAAEMSEAVLSAVIGSDALIMAAAPADYRPAHPSEQKIKKDYSDRLTIDLERNSDILEEVARRRAKDAHSGPRAVVGFAAETDDLVQNAKAKMESKRLDLIVGNQVPETFGSDAVRAVMLDPSGVVTELAQMPKEQLADVILDRIESIIL